MRAAEASPARRVGPGLRRAVALGPRRWPSWSQLQNLAASPQVTSKMGQLAACGSGLSLNE